MFLPDLDCGFENKIRLKTKNWFVFFGIFFMYLALRCLAWKSTILLEDHDSISYLRHITVFLNFDLQQIVNLDPDSTPFYPLFGALCSLPGWSVETGARLCSLLFSMLLFLAVIGIGKQIAERSSVLIGLLILSLSPILVFLSISVLTEPSYIALIYLGFWLFLTQYENPTFGKAPLLGIIFGLAFLNRTEGFLYLAFIPLLQGAHFLLEGRKHYALRQFIGWAFLFVFCFSMIAIPQIWRVSHKMGQLAINGRQAWMAILNNPDGKTYNEKIYGLDFSPSQLNIYYIKSHPIVMSEFASTKGLKYYLDVFKKFMHNLKDLYQNRLGVLIGPIGLIFFGFGLIELYRSGRFFEVLLIAAFIVLNLVAPLMHNVAIRHIAVISPLIMIVEGAGVVYLYRTLSSMQQSASLVRLVITFVFFFPLIVESAYPLLKNSLRSEHFNYEYSPDDLRKPVKIVKQIARDEMVRSPNISARKGYLAYFAEGTQLAIPHTTYEGLVKYCDMNNVDFVYLQHRLLSGYPFLSEFLKNNSAPDFALLYIAKDRSGRNMELYRFQKPNESAISYTRGSSG